MLQATMTGLLPRPKSSFGPRAAANRWANHRYHESTGQVYIETIAHIQTSDDRDWAKKTKLFAGPSFQERQEYAQYVRSWLEGENFHGTYYEKLLDELKNPNPGKRKGSRALEDHAIECILSKIADITLEMIQRLPPHLVHRLWYTINKRCTMCFNTWSAFSKVLRDCEMPSLNLLRYRQEIRVPKSPLPIYAKTITSEAFDFITSLKITTNFSVPDLVKLTKITNLGVLEIINNDVEITNYDISQGIDDRIIREWHTACCKDGAFKVLRILKLCNHKELTSKSLKHVSNFPSLAVYDVRGCNFGPGAYAHAQSLGWKEARATTFLNVLDHQCTNRALEMRGNREGEDATHRYSQRYDSRPLDDDAKVRRIPRAEIPEMLSEKGMSINSATRLPINPYAFFKPWDFETYSAFARIGELRNDEDLARAGVSIGEQAAVKEELVNSVPMVSICLGEAHLASSIPQGGSLRSFTFIRTQLPSKDAKTNIQTVSALSGTSKAPQKRQGPQFGIMRLKKRKLDDVLSSFH